MPAVTNLTPRAIVLCQGRVVFDGQSAEAVEHYIGLGKSQGTHKAALGRGLHTAISRVRLLEEAGGPVGHYTPGTPLRIEVVLDTDGASGLSLEALLVDPAGQKLGLASVHHFHGLTLSEHAGRYRTVLELAPMWLASGTYGLDLTTSVVNSNWDHYVEDALEFDVVSSNPGRQAWDVRHNLGYGALALPGARPPEFVREPNGAENAGLG